jgi:segregation and condensation protein B
VSETPVTAEGGSSLMLRLEGFEGPLDLLLDLARGQKLDLSKISILALVDQYLAIIEGARRIRLELAADWLVMAAWLAWLKSRLLVPAGVEEAEDADMAAETLAGRLAELQAMRAAALWLGRRPQLGLDVFARGMPENLTETDRSGLLLDLPSLLRGHIGALRRQAATRRYVPRPMERAGRVAAAGVDARADAGLDGADDLPARGDAVGAACPPRGPGEHAARGAGDGTGRRDRPASGRDLRTDHGQAWQRVAGLVDGAALIHPTKGVVGWISAAQSTVMGRNVRMTDTTTISDDSLRLVEAMLFAAAAPVSMRALTALLPDTEEAETVIAALRERYVGRGVELVAVGGGVQFRTAPDLARRLTRVIEVPRRLPRVAMETLAIIAYRQPVTRGEIEEVRGTTLSQSTMDTLLEAELIAPAGRRDSPGRPTLWATTPAFLSKFGLKALSDLPRRDDLMNDTALMATNPPETPMGTEAAQFPNT